MAPKGFVVVTLAFHREGRGWVGVCEELGTSAYGRTLDRTRVELEDLVLLHLNTLEQEGEHERFFAENGMRFYRDEPPQEVSVRPTEVKPGGSSAEDLPYLLPLTYPFPFPVAPAARKRRRTAFGTRRHKNVLVQ